MREKPPRVKPLHLFGAKMPRLTNTLNIRRRSHAGGSHGPPNRLAGETSPYRLQHARNPVDWYPRGMEAVDRVRDENRPILLSNGYSACHWCHVMANESFEDETTAAVMNDQFIDIKVDSEERPDLDRIYHTGPVLRRDIFRLNPGITSPPSRNFWGPVNLWREACEETVDRRRAAFTLPESGRDSPGVLAERHSPGRVTAFICCGTQCRNLTDLETLRKELPSADS